jgi:DNA-directed RNA polymerase specialized sigma24 family protein
MSREIGERLDSALRRAAERQRAVFVLRHYQDQSASRRSRRPWT